MGGLRWMRLGTRRMDELRSGVDGESVHACAVESRVDQSGFAKIGKAIEKSVERLHRLCSVCNSHDRKLASPAAHSPLSSSTSIRPPTSPPLFPSKSRPLSFTSAYHLPQSPPISSKPANSALVALLSPSCRPRRLALASTACPTSPITSIRSTTGTLSTTRIGLRRPSPWIRMTLGELFLFSSPLMLPVTFCPKALLGFHLLL